MTDPRHRLGIAAEAAVGDALRRRGWRILATRWRVPAGEIDLVCEDAGGVLVAVEVRARRSPRAGRAAETVDRYRLLRLRAALLAYAATRPGPPTALRIDLVSVERVDGRWHASRRAAIDGW